MIKLLNQFAASLFASVALLGMMADFAHAQSVRLSADDMRLINQLPPAQRQRALEAVEQLNNAEAGNGSDPAAQEELSTPPVEFGESMEDDEEQEPSTATAGSRLIVTFSPLDELTEDELTDIREDQALQQLEGTRFFELDDDGMLHLPGLQSVDLNGLDAESVEERLSAEEPLRVFEITARILNQEPAGPAQLELFGQRLFGPSDTVIEPVTSGPVPPDYVLGPGDTLHVQLFGNVNRTDNVEISRDGQLQIPELGPIDAAGMRFAAFRDDLVRRVEETLIGTRVSVSIGQLRTVRVFLMGDVERPGSYVVSSLATISSALSVGGGISEIGSLRNVELKRNGRQVTMIDLYDFLLRGDTTEDFRLQPGDVIFVHPLGPTVAIAGAVRRPAIYELADEETLQGVIDLAGGLLPEAYAQASRIERIDEQKNRVIVSVDGSPESASTVSVRAGDTVIVPKVLEEFRESVHLVGHVERPGPYQLRNNMRLTDLIPSSMHLKQGADPNYVLIRRKDPYSLSISARSADLEKAWANPASQANVILNDDDRIYVFNREFGRQRVIEPLLNQLSLQSNFNRPHRIVEISGEVMAPGPYPLEPGMRISDLLRAGGSLSESAYLPIAELARYRTSDDGERITEIVSVDLDRIVAGDTSADMVLLQHDHLRVSTTPDWNAQWTVELEGEVRFPGQYRIRRSESLSQLIERAGGLTDEAFPEGAIFLREALKEREQEQIRQLVRRLESDLAALSLQSAGTSGADTLTTGQALLAQLRETEAVGRLVIDLEDLIAQEQSGNAVRLMDGDRLLIPVESQVVTVIGEVQQSTSHLYDPALDRDDYLRLSGGVTRRADSKLTYVVRANGAVVAGGQSRWFARGSGARIRPGDTIVVPMETDKIRPLTFWGSVTQILYQGAIAVSAIRTFDR